MPWPEITVESWDHLLSLIANHDSGDPTEVPYLYRGQSNAEWALVDSLSRLMKPEAEWDDARKLEMDAFSSFVARAHLFLEASSLPVDESILAWWSLMQHYGAPTRLLDWSISPYVGVYFAVLERWDEPGAVWAFDPNALTDSIDSPEVEEVRSVLAESKDTRTVFWHKIPPDFVHAFAMKKLHTRLSTQQGSFTVCGHMPRKHDEMIEKAFGEQKAKYCKKLVVRPDSKPEFLRNLRRMNITAGSLFPGVDGLGRSISELVRLEAKHLRLI